ncbi:MAG: site-2 protease family protein [bacterium]|nr:site-2 protease family protein [bacterium]
MITAMLVIAILVVLIVVHELGHFIAAKIFKVRVEEFGVGYPPRAFLFGKIGETEYTFNWLPFGGFVRLFGDEGETEHGKGSFVDAPRHVQAVILVAGVVANAVLAWGLFAGALTLGIPRVVDVPRPNETVHLVVADVVAGSPAEASGITSGDEIVGMRDDKGIELAQLTPDTVMDFVRARGGKQIFISYERAGTTTVVELRPAHAVIEDNAGRPAVGVALVLAGNDALPFGEALKESLYRTGSAFKQVGAGLWSIVRGVVSGKPNLSEVIGPVGLVGVVSDAATHGFANVLALAGFISVNLAIINLIPIPALDGGRLLLLAIEAVWRRSAPRILVQMLNLLGVVLIALLMITVTYNDIARLFS